MADYTPLLKAIEKVLAKADADLEAFLEEQGYPNPAGLVEAIDSVQDVLEELLDDYLERIATALIDCTDKFELMDAWNEAKEDAELKRTASDAVAEALLSYALPFLDEYIKNDDEELDASELSLKAIAEVLTLADQMTEGKIDSLNDRIEAGLQNYKEPEDSEADKAEKAAVEKGVLDDLKAKLRGLSSKIKSFGQRAIEYVFGSSKLDRARDCRSTATQTVLMYESVVQQEAIMQNPVVERKIWRHNPSEHPRENHVAMDGVMADADGFFELTGRDGTVYHIEGPRASSLPPSESYNCHCTIETVTNAEILNSDVETKSTLQDEAVANANEVFKTSADKELYERAMEWAEKFTNGSNSATLNETDTRAILDYMSSGVAYSLNEALRTGQELTEAQKNVVKNLDTALEKLPDYAGTVYRSVSTEMIEDPAAFLAQYQKDNIVRSLAYTSTGKDVYDPDMEIQYVITAKHGKDISNLNKNEQEVLFRRGAKFIVDKVDGKTIYMTEV